MSNEGIKVGSTIVVVNESCTWDYYQQMANLFELTDWHLGELPTEGQRYKIADIRNNPDSSELVYIVRSDSGQEFMMSGDGIELSHNLPDVFYFRVPPSSVSPELVHKGVVIGNEVEVEWNLIHLKRCENDDMWTTARIRDVECYLESGRWTFAEQPFDTEFSIEYGGVRYKFIVEDGIFHLYNYEGTELLNSFWREYEIRGHIERGDWECVENYTPPVHPFQARLDYFETHIAAVEENLASLKSAFVELKGEVLAGK